MCGGQPVPSLRLTVVAAALAGSHRLGKLELTLCRLCSDIRRRPGLPSWYTVIQMRIDQEKPGFLPAGFPVSRRTAPGLTYAGRVMKFRDEDLPEPTSGRPFSHLPKNPRDVEIETETPKPKPVDPHPWQIDQGCLICGLEANGRSLRMSYKPWGLEPLKGLPSRVSGRLCGPRCEIALDAGLRSRLYYVNIPGVSPVVALATEQRLREEKPELLITLPGPVFPPEVLPRLTWAGHTIESRRRGDPDPQLGKAFGWL